MLSTLSCEVCGKTLRNIRGFAGHLRHNTDPEHVALKLKWKAQYQATLRCRKCGGTWDITTKSEKDCKRCPSCVAKRQRLGKRTYEKVATAQRVPHTEAPKIPSEVQWVPEDILYESVASSIRSGEKVLETLKRLAITYKVYRAIGEHLLGRDGYQSQMRAVKRRVGQENIASAHRMYWLMTDEEKASYIESKFGGTHALETAFAEQLRASGVDGIGMNLWQSVPIDGRMVPREADIKVTVDQDRKIVVLCDGEAFHGPRAVFMDPTARVRDDVVTAEAYFSLGYSVLRYSESEIKSGAALDHFRSVHERLQSGVTRIYRTWHPAVERVVST